MADMFTNYLRFEGEFATIRAAISSILSRDEKGELQVDFNKIILMPDRLNIPAGGHNHEYVALYLNSDNGPNRIALMSLLDRFVCRQSVCVFRGGYYLPRRVYGVFSDAHCRRTCVGLYA